MRFKQRGLSTFSGINGMSKVFEQVFEATREETPGIFALMERGYYRNLIKVHLNILYNNDPVYDIHDVLGKEITRNIVVPVMEESRLIARREDGTYFTEYGRINVKVSQESKLLFFRSLEPIMIDISKRAHQESPDRFAKSSAYINKRGDKTYIEAQIKTLYECIYKLDNAPIADDPADNIDLELLFASIREKS